MSTSLLRRPGFLSTTASRDPFAMIDEEMRNWLSNLGENGFSVTRMMPSLDVSETDGALEVNMDVPGVEPREIDIQVNGQTLTISGSRESEEEEKGKTFHRVERRFGSFSRSVTLPCTVNEQGVTADIHEGVLTVMLPKSEVAKSHKIPVKPR